MKIIQIAATRNILYALDEDGNIWYKNLFPGNGQNYDWVKVKPPKFK